MKKIMPLICILFIIVAWCVQPVQAGESTSGGLVVLDSSAKVDFPSRLSFHLSASNDTPITDIRLRYSVDRMQFAPVFCEGFIEFKPAASVNVDWALDMVKIGGLPPGTKIDYWWLIRDFTGRQTETPSARISFDDNRYTWQSITADNVTIYWYSGDKAFARKLADITRESLARLEEYTGARLEKPVSMFVYPNSKDLLSAMIYPQEWVGGVAFTRYGIVALNIAPGDLTWAKEVIPHELTHQVTDQMVFNPYNSMPTWLKEGLAMYVEGNLSGELQGYLDNGIARNKLISVQSLCSPFPADRQAAALSYAQSHSLADYLINTYGQSRMLELLETFIQGAGYNEALTAVYGFDMDTLDTLWRKYVNATEQAATPATATETTALPQRVGLNPVLIGILAGLAMVVVALLTVWLKKWAVNRRI